MVDFSDNDDFQSKLEPLLIKWENLETSISSNLNDFIQYFVSNKVDVVRDTMLQPIREECGLGNPPDIFTTNPSKSVNDMLKHKVDYKKNDLPAFVEKIREFINEQNNELQRAVINRGKYRF